MAAMRSLPTVVRPALLALLLLAAGCSTLDVPRADNYAASGQKKVRAVHHWDVLADDVAARVANKISEWPAGEHPIYLASTADVYYIDRADAALYRGAAAPAPMPALTTWQVVKP